MTPNDSGAQDTKEYECPTCSKITDVILAGNVLTCKHCGAKYSLHKAEGNNQYTFRKIQPNGFPTPTMDRYQTFSNIYSGVPQSFTLIT